jgi:hypothetical protein
MSKKKGKPVAKKAPKKAVKKKVVKKAVAASRIRTARMTSADTAASGRTLHMSIFLFKTGNGNKIRTSPQKLYANPGDFVEWTVVNLIDGTDVPVTITWPEAGPWGKDPIEIRGWNRKPFGEAAGRFKFVVSAYDTMEDPEMELPDGN